MCRLRSRKDEQERELMRIASRINDSVIEKARDYVREGMTEKQVARFIDEQYLKEGAEGNSFTTIVSFGANAADPHHEPDDTVLKNGQCILIDMGCIKDGYCSDMTRTFFYGSVTDREKEIYEPGMIFSIEPGIYLSGDFGVRIEDLVMVTEDGCEVLNHVDKKLQVIGK